MTGRLERGATYELFLGREQAEAFIAEVEHDEPETAALLRVEAIEPDGFSASTN